MDLKPAPETVSQRLKGQFAPAYLTLSSIIQGVALAFLAAGVEATYAQFDATNWLLTAATFVGFLTVWNEYLILPRFDGVAKRGIDYAIKGEQDGQATENLYAGVQTGSGAARQEERQTDESYCARPGS